MSHFSKNLLDWFADNSRDLPWRKTKEPYVVWLSEVILQQTRVSQGLPYFEKFIDAYPTVHDLAKASEDELLKLWQGLGYYSRARNLHTTAKYVSEELDGVFPDTYDELLSLKGVGGYTASAIASICFDELTPVVDGNVYRVLSRLYAIYTPINTSEGLKEFKTLASTLIDVNRPGDFNQAIMELGATVCKPQITDCERCPFTIKCIAFENQTIKELPVKLKKTPANKLNFNYLVFVSKDEKTIFKQRIEKGIWYHLYEFPLIVSDKKLSKNKINESIELKEYLDGDYSLSLFNSKPIIHKLSHIHIAAQFWIVKVDSLENAIPIDTLSKYPVPRLIENFIEECEHL